MNRIRIYVGTDAVQVSLDDVHDTASTYLIEQYGGFTAFPGHGGWQNDDGKVFNEPSLVYEIVGAINAHEAGMAAHYLKVLYRQESVLLTREELDGVFV